MTAYAVQKVVAQYCQFIDDARFDDLAALFAEDGVLDVSSFGIRKEGRQAVRDQFRQLTDPSVKGTHCTFNPIIDISGGTATGSFDYLWVGYNKQPQIGIAGRYRLRFVASGERWLISEMKVEVRSNPAHIAAAQ